MFKLSKKGGYALKAIIFIARAEKIIHVSDISESEKISLSLLRRIIADLEKSGIIKTIKGRNGGVQLGKKINTISIYDVLNAVGEELAITDCTKGVFCEREEGCTTTGLINNLQGGFNSLLKMYTLDKVI